MASLKPLHSVKESAFHFSSDHCQVNTFLELGSGQMSQAVIWINFYEHVQWSGPNIIIAQPCKYFPKLICHLRSFNSKCCCRKATTKFQTLVLAFQTFTRVLIMAIWLESFPHKASQRAGRFSRAVLGALRCCSCTREACRHCMSQR